MVFLSIETQEKECNFSNIKSNDIIRSEKYVTFNHKINKFIKDKIFYKQSDYLIVLNGAILNKKELTEKYSINNNDNEWCTIVKRMYDQNGKKSFDEFRSSFSGVFRVNARDITLLSAVKMYF